MCELKDISLRERIRLNLVAAMERANVNQVQLADKLGISKGTVNNWTRGNNSPDVDIVPKICNVLGLSIQEFYSPSEIEMKYIQHQKSPSPSTDESAPEEGPISLEQSNELLVALGLIQEGGELSDDDLMFLEHIMGLLEAWFRKGH